MSTAATPKRSKPSTENGAYTSGSAQPARTEKRGASHAAGLTTLARYSADTSRADDTGAHAGTQTTQSPSAPPATFSTKETSGYSVATSTPSAPDWPKPSTTEPTPNGPSSWTIYSPESSSSEPKTVGWWRSTSDSTERDPWAISPKVHQWMERHLPRRACVLELGGGAGTPALHDIFPNAITVEHDERYLRMLRRLGMYVIHAPLRSGWYTLTPELEQAIRSADVLLIDGPPGGLRRNGAAHIALAKAGACIIYDDSQRADVRAGIAYPVVVELQDKHRTTTVTRKDSRA